MRMQWTEEKIGGRVFAAVATLGIDRMPTVSELTSIGENALACAMTKTLGMDGWAERLRLAQADHDSRCGWKWEEWFAAEAEARGFTVVRRERIKEATDLHVAGKSVDVKSACGALVAGDMQWTWRIARERHAAELYVFIATEARLPPVVHVVPASEVPLTCATMRRGGKYRAWRDRWDLFL